MVWLLQVRGCRYWHLTTGGVLSHQDYRYQTSLRLKNNLSTWGDGDAALTHLCVCVNESGTLSSSSSLLPPPLVSWRWFRRKHHKQSRDILRHPHSVRGKYLCDGGRAQPSTAIITVTAQRQSTMTLIQHTTPYHKGLDQLHQDQREPESQTCNFHLIRIRKPD